MMEIDPRLTVYQIPVSTVPFDYISLPNRHIKPKYLVFNTSIITRVVIGGWGWGGGGGVMTRESLFMFQ